MSLPPKVIPASITLGDAGLPTVWEGELRVTPLGRKVTVSGSLSPCHLLLTPLSGWEPKQVQALLCSAQEIPGAPGSLANASAHRQCTLPAALHLGLVTAHPSAWGQEDTGGSGNRARVCVWQHPRCAFM